MKIYAFLALAALLFSGCGTTWYGLEMGLQTSPEGANIVCKDENGKEVEVPPKFFLGGEDYRKLQDGKEHGLPKCKAVWVSGYEDYFRMSAKVEEFLPAGSYEAQNGDTVKRYVFAQKLTRPRGEGYEADLLAERRLTVLKNAPQLSLSAYPRGAQILCDSFMNDAVAVRSFISVALKTGILRIGRCKAVWVSGYEAAFKDSINIDKEDIRTLFVQTLNRPHTEGYDKDALYALELEKKEILEANERARTRAAQEQAEAAWVGAQAARDQADAAERQSQSIQNSLRNNFQIRRPINCFTTGNFTSCF